MAEEQQQQHKHFIKNTGDFRPQEEIFVVARSKAEKDRVHQVAIEESLKGAFYGLVAATATHMALSRYTNFWTRMHHTPRWIILIAFPTVGFVLQGEHAALEVEREYALKRSYVKVGKRKAIT